MNISLKHYQDAMQKISLLIALSSFTAFAMNSQEPTKLSDERKDVCAELFSNAGTLTVAQLNLFVKRHFTSVAELSQVCHKKRSFLHHVIEKNGNLELLEHLLQHDARTHSKHFDVQPLELAMNLNRSEMVDLFIKYLVATPPINPPVPHNIKPEKSDYYFRWPSALYTSAILGSCLLLGSYLIKSDRSSIQSVKA